MAVNWTKEQLDAIYSTGQNILVSAGAGSGKTAVLSERVLQHILVDGYNVNELLVLTFTNAAAASMKNKIRKTIKKSDKLDKQQKESQLNKIDDSYIMTFDAYALALVKKYHYLLGVDAKISVIDSGILQIVTERLLDEVMLAHYTKREEPFTKLINDFCVKDDSIIREAVISINNKLNMIYDRNTYVSEYDKNFFNDAFVQSLFSEYEKLVLLKLKRLDYKMNLLSELLDLEEYYPMDQFRSFLSSESFEAMKEYFPTGKIKNAPKGSDKELTDLKKEIKGILDDIQKDLSFSKEDLIQQVYDTKDYSDCLLLLAEQLNEKLMEYKQENNLYEFNDIFKLAIDIVDKHKAVKEEIKAYFKEILIDEYQDTNDLQDEFIKRICNNNVYMVGDIKQSIYRFRNANPSIFKDKYEAYKRNDGGKAIDLLKNFRSRGEVLSDINVIFDRLMDSKIGGADYASGHEMVHGNMDYDNYGATNQNNHLEILSYNYSSKEKYFPFTELASSEVEAFIIAKDIKEKVESGYQVYVENPLTKQFELRACRYSDFCILLDRGTYFEAYKQIMTYLGIPLEILQEEGMGSSDLMTVIKSSFRLVECMQNKDYGYDFVYSYASIARSFIFMMSDEQLHDIITNRTFFDTEICQKMSKITRGIETKSIAQILTEIIEAFDIYAKLNRIGDVKSNNVKLEYLFKLTHSLNEMKYTYRDFDDYLEQIFDKQQKDLSFNSSKGEVNAVQIMTIHKSKGLEFTICYFPGLYRQFNDSDKKIKIGFEKQLGIIIPSMIKDYGLKDTMKKDVMKYGFTSDDISEKIRLFYVALTRTREKMIAIGPLVDESDNDFIIDDDRRLAMKNFISMLNPIYSDLNGKNGITITDVFAEGNDLSGYGFTNQYRSNKKNIFAGIAKDAEQIEVKKLAIYEPIDIKKSSFSKNAGLIDATTQAKMDFGTEMHYYLETLDFVNPDFSSIPNKYQKNIKAFLASEIMKSASSGKSYREFEFIYLDRNSEEKHGFIDLLMEYEDHFDIIDYKLKNIDDSHYDEQLNGYRQYLKSISDKKVNCYLYSIIDSTYREVIE